jgi:hypothetical protein
MITWLFTFERDASTVGLVELWIDSITISFLHATTVMVLDFKPYIQLFDAMEMSENDPFVKVIN